MKNEFRGTLIEIDRNLNNVNVSIDWKYDSILECLNYLHEHKIESNSFKMNSKTIEKLKFEPPSLNIELIGGDLFFKGLKISADNELTDNLIKLVKI